MFKLSPNRALEKILDKHLHMADLEPATPEEQAYAKSIWESLTEGERKNAIDLNKGFGYFGDGSEFEGKYLTDTISEYVASDEIMAGSTDVSDVSWIVPTAQLSAATSALGTPLHTWQMTTQGISTFAHNGMMRAAEAMAGAAIELYVNPAGLIEVKQEHEETFAHEPYVCPIPANVKPSAMK